MNELKPLRTNVIVKRIPEPISSSLIAPKPLHHSNYAEVLAIGPKCQSVQVGDTILIGNRMKSDFQMEGQDRLCIEEDEVLVIFPRKKF